MFTIEVESLVEEIAVLTEGWEEFRFLPDGDTVNPAEILGDSQCEVPSPRQSSHLGLRVLFGAGTRSALRLYSRGTNGTVRGRECQGNRLR